jgi:hypothetical protein
MNVTEIRLRLLIAYAAPTSRNSNALVYSAASSTRITTPNEIQRYQRTAPKIAKPCRLGFRKETSPPVWWKISSFCLCSHFLSLWGVLNKGCRSPWPDRRTPVVTVHLAQGEHRTGRPNQRPSRGSPLSGFLCARLPSPTTCGSALSATSLTKVSTPLGRPSPL